MIRGRWALGVVIAGWSVAGWSIAGCSLDRTAIQTGDSGSSGRDGGSMPIDGGPRCLDGDCDDGNPCTDDRCDPATGCVNEPNAATCDDGVLCNGADSCSAGSCSRHDGVDPCPGVTTCDVASDTCIGCASAADCPAEMTGDYGACAFPTDVCATSGSRSRTVTSYACVATRCEATDRTETEVCVRSTDGVGCGGATTSDWSACTYADACTNVGTRTRTVTSSACSGGICTPVTITETDTTGCARDTTGATCGATLIEPWSACEGFADDCDTTGTQTRSTTAYVCGGGACSPSVTIESMSCTRSTDGDACGAEVCGAFGPCAQTNPGTCDTLGSQTRTCSTAVCGGGTCSASGSTRTDGRLCRVSVTGGSCTAPATACGPCIEEGRGSCRSSQMGFQTCTGGMGTCSAPDTCVAAGTVLVPCACP